MKNIEEAEKPNTYCCMCSSRTFWHLLDAPLFLIGMVPGLFHCICRMALTLKLEILQSVFYNTVAFLLAFHRALGNSEAKLFLF